MPLAPLVIVIHVPARTAVQLQPGAAVTAIDPVPPAGLKPWLVGVIAKPHVPACVTTNVAVATVTVATLDVPVAFAVAWNVTVAFPVR